MSLAEGLLVVEPIVLPFPRLSIGFSRMLLPEDCTEEFLLEFVEPGCRPTDGSCSLGCRETSSISGKACVCRTSVVMVG